MYEKERAKADVLIEAIPYMRKFAGTIVVVKYGGSAMVDEKLKKSVIKDIALKFIAELKKRMAENDIELKISDEALNNIAVAGYDLEFGARPMKRHIQRAIESKLAKTIIANPDAKEILIDFKDNDYKIMVNKRL